MDEETKKRFLAFCQQAAAGPYMAQMRAKKATIENVFLNYEEAIKLNKLYNMDCWNDFHNHTDSYIEEEFNAMLKSGFFKHVSCLMDGMQKVVTATFQDLKQNATLMHFGSTGNSGDVKALRSLVHEIVSTSLNKQELPTQACGEHCQPRAYTGGPCCKSISQLLRALGHDVLNDL